MQESDSAPGNESPAAPSGAQPELNEIGGWLAFFIAVFSIGAVMNLVLGVMQVVTWLSSSDVIAGLVLAALGGYGGFCMRRLWDKDPSAPSHAQQYMGLAASFTLVLGLITEASGAGRGFLFWAIWGTYLARSRRVAAVYRRAPGRQ